MEILITRTAFPVKALGPGTRAAIWMQGCSIRCAGCVAQDTWGTPTSSRGRVDDILDWLASCGQIDGVTISGGEPTDQPQALQALMSGIRRTQPAADILVYTGRPTSWVLGDGRPSIAGADAVVTEPFVEAEAGYLPLRGSDNQQLLALTPLGRSRYVDVALPDRRRVQVDVVDGEIRMIGIPTPGVLAELGQRAAAAGLSLRGTSWQD